MSLGKTRGGSMAGCCHAAFVYVNPRARVFSGGTRFVGARSDFPSHGASEALTMRHPSSPPTGGAPRTRGAIRTHLGRKRLGGRSRTLDRRPGELDRRQQEDLFDRLMSRFQDLFETAGEKTAAT